MTKFFLHGEGPVGIMSALIHLAALFIGYGTMLIGGAGLTVVAWERIVCFICRSLRLNQEIIAFFFARARAQKAKKESK